MSCWMRRGVSSFQSTRPIRGATARRSTPSGAPASFQSTRPIRGATCCCPRGAGQRRHFNPRAPYGARPERDVVERVVMAISIHAPHTGRDRRAASSMIWSLSFQSTRPIRGATSTTGGSESDVLFQSTRPIRGATTPTSTSSPGKTNFNPRAPYGARPSRASCWSSFRRPFQSTRPIRGATSWSIRQNSSPANFNPRAPYGARLLMDYYTLADLKFQSTRPIRGATGSRPVSVAARQISIHAPHTGRDESWSAASEAIFKFQSTRPIRGATADRPALLLRRPFQSTRPIRGATQRHRPQDQGRQISIHAPHTGRDSKNA